MQTLKPSSDFTNAEFQDHTSSFPVGPKCTCHKHTHAQKHSEGCDRTKLQYRHQQAPCPWDTPRTGSSYSGPKVVRAQLRVCPTTTHQVLHRPGPTRWKQAQERAGIDRNVASSKRANSLDGGEKGKRRREDVKTQQSQATQHSTDPEATTVRTNSRT